MQTPKKTRKGTARPNRKEPCTSKRKDQYARLTDFVNPKIEDYKAIDALQGCERKPSKSIRIIRLLAGACLVCVNFASPKAK